MPQAQEQQKSFKPTLFFSLLAFGTSLTILILLLIWNGVAFDNNPLYTVVSCNTSYFTDKYNHAATFRNIFFLATATLVGSNFALFISILSVIKMKNYHHNYTFGLLSFFSIVSNLANVPILGYLISIWIDQKDCIIQWKGINIMTFIILAGATCFLSLILFLMLGCACNHQSKHSIYKQVDATMKTQDKQKQHETKFKKKQKELSYRINPPQKNKNSYPSKLYQSNLKHLSPLQTNYNDNDNRKYLHRQRNNNYQDQFKPNLRNQYTSEQPSYLLRPHYNTPPQIVDPFLEQKIARNPNYQKESVIHNLHHSFRNMDPRNYVEYLRQGEQQLYRQGKKYLTNAKKNIPLNNLKNSDYYFKSNQNQISKQPYLSNIRKYQRNQYT